MTAHISVLITAGPPDMRARCAALREWGKMGQRGSNLWPVPADPRSTSGCWTVLPAVGV